MNTTVIAAARRARIVNASLSTKTDARATAAAAVEAFAASGGVIKAAKTKTPRAPARVAALESLGDAAVELADPAAIAAAISAARPTRRKVTLSGGKLAAPAIDPADFPANDEPPVKARRAPKADRPATLTIKAQREAKAAAGDLPTPPTFPEHKTWNTCRNKLAAVVALVDAGDVAALRALTIPTYDTGVKAIARFRDLAVIALEARATQ